MSVDLERFTYSCSVDNVVQCVEQLEAALHILKAAGENYVDSAADPDTAKAAEVLQRLRTLLS